MDTALRPTGDDAETRSAGSARWWVVAVVLWSLFVWATRIDNIVADEGLDGAARAWRLGLALSFVVPALLTALLWWRRPGGRAAVGSVTVLAVWTIVVWIVRGAGIALGDHAAAFVAVHLVLAAVSIALAVMVLRVIPGGVAFLVGRSPH